MNEIAVCLFASSGFDKAAQGLVGEGRRLADQAGGRLSAIVVGAAAEAVAEQLAPMADAVVIADQAELAEYQPELYLAALTGLCRERKPGLILFSNEAYSQELVPRLAHRLGGSAVGDGTAVKLEGGAVFVTRQVYGGKAEAVLQMKRQPVVVWLRARSFAPAAARAARGEIRRAVLDLTCTVRARIVERRQDDSGQARLEDARVIVSGGRGIGGAEPFANELRPLAEKLGGQLAASRAACDAGWVPATWQVGQTGKKVAPELYLAVALSGSSQHMAGVSEAKNIVAINTDPEAPIFRYCRLGLVGDYRQVVPLLRAKLTPSGK
jgi:electron transfer flavoprotein alpha subunit